MPKASAQDPPDGPVPVGPSDTRRRLLSAAASTIASRGWGGVTTRKVAASAGVNQALVHYHFGSIDALRREAALDVLVREVSGPTLALVEEPSITDGLRRCVGAVAEMDPRSDEALVLYEAMLAAVRDDELRAMLGSALEAFRDLVAGRIAAAGGSDPAAAAAVLAAALDGILLHRLVTPDLDTECMAGPLVASLGLPTPPGQADPPRTAGEPG